MDLRTFFPVTCWFGSRPKPGGAKRRGLFRDQRGAVAPLFLVTATAVLGSSFGAIDLVRYNVVQGRLQNALDGATLSAGRNLANLTPTPGTPEEGAWQADAFQYFRTNLPDGYLGSSVQPEDLKIEYGEDTNNGYLAGQFVSMSVKGDLPLISTGFLHVTSFQIGASNKAVRRTRSDLEVVLALDNTGSMSGTKIDTLKSAAKELTKVVLGAVPADAPKSVFIGLVPFADTVNVGNSALTRQWVSYPSERTNYITNLWGGCIVEPPVASWGGGNLPAAAWTPGAGVFQPLYMIMPSILGVKELDLEDGKGKVKTYERIPVGTVDKPQPSSFSATGNDVYRLVKAERSSSTSLTAYTLHSPSNCRIERQVRFLNNDLDKIDLAIDAMTADGSTLIPTGLLWAWRMLRPDWRGTPGWGDEAKPRDPDPTGLSKVIVLLTDGENSPPGGTGVSSTERNFAFKLGYDKQVCTDKGRADKDCNLTLIASTYPPASKTSSVSSDSQSPLNSLKMREPLGSDNSTTIGWDSPSPMSTTTVDKYMGELCSKVKADGNGIKIYTVTLGDVGSSAEALMNGCSSGAGYFYNATNVSTLPDVFKSIAGSLTELRLTQ